MTPVNVTVDGKASRVAAPTSTVADLVVRPATAADNDACCDLFSRITMDADVVLSVDRSPEFTALYRLQGEIWTCWVGERDGTLEGMGAILVRDGYVAGAPAKVGYLGDLRVAPGLQGLGLLGRFYEPALRQACDATGARVFLTAVIASNRRAIAALTGPTAAERGIPRYSLLRRFSIRSVHNTVPRPRRRTGYGVRRATPADIPTLAAFLDADGRGRPYGYAVTEEELRRRLATWPGLAITDFLLALDRAGDLVGCLAVWDPSAVKRTTVQAYRGRMRTVRAGYNAAATILRFPHLPAPGRVLPYAYITHQAIPSENPAVMASLLDSAYADLRRTGRALLSVCVWDDDPLAGAYRGFVTTDLPTHLYAVTPTGVPAPPACDATARPGFEMALV